MTAGVSLALFLGALAGVAAVGAWGSVAPALAMAPLVCAIAVDWRRPRELGGRHPGANLE